MLMWKIRIQAEFALLRHKNIEFTEASNLKKPFAVSDIVLMAKKKGMQVRCNLADIS